MYKYYAIDMEASSKRILQLCKSKGMTAAQVRDACGLGSANAVYHWWKGDRLPNVDSSLRLSRVLGLTCMDDLFVLIETEGCERCLSPPLP